MSAPHKMTQAIYDLPRLLAFREALESLDLAASPTARVLYPSTTTQLRRVGILCGSFNPLTLAHTELAERARQAFALDCVFFTLAKVTVDKEQATGMSLEDRLLVLNLYAQHHNHLGVALVNRGLYFEQAQAFRTLLGPQAVLHFVIGMDKLFQILDPRYYQDREAALQQLFSLASLLIANRSDMDQHVFTQLLDQPENRPYRPSLHFFLLPAEVTDLSATAVRNALAAGEPVDKQVPQETAAFVSETRSYHPPLQSGNETLDAYAVRSHLFELLATARPWAPQEADFRRLLHVALSTSEKGRRLRRFSGGENLLLLLRSCQEES
jgi:nicotinamide-nucleotide adenylyltransferase